MIRFVTCAAAAPRLEAAAAWLADRPRTAPLVVIAPTHEAGADIVRRAGPSFGWHVTTLGRLAVTMATPSLATSGLAPAGRSILDALAIRVVNELARTANGSVGLTPLGRFARVADRPGLPLALCSTLVELRLAGLGPGAVPGELAGLATAFEAALEQHALADRAAVLHLAAAAARAGGGQFKTWPLLLLDVPLAHASEVAFVRALAAHASQVFASSPAGDAASVRALRAALGVDPDELEVPGSRSLARVQRALFASTAEPGALDDQVTLISAPGEARECVEVARLIHAEASRGVSFDRIAIVLRTPEAYAGPLAEALRRAGLPTWWTLGTRNPDPSGRALLALLACAAERLSAKRFSEYLSLGEVPNTDPAGAPRQPTSDAFVPAGDELLAVPEATEHTEPAAEPPDGPVVAGTLKVPRGWEDLLVEAAVIGGRERWQRRLSGLRVQLLRERDAADADDPSRLRLERRVRELDHLRAFALPLLDLLSTLPSGSTWGAWIEALTDLAGRALRLPDRVLAVLSELRPMAPVGPVSLVDVIALLTPRLTQLHERPTGSRAGRVFVGTPEAVRGLAFEVVFTPGLAERLFPKKVVEDPILLDADRPDGLAKNPDRIAGERLALELAVGAASQRLILSWPRLDLEQGRPRVPSFYTLEVVRAAEGTLPGYEALARRAEHAAKARIAWPAPDRPGDAIDDAEYDLALLDGLVRNPERGRARYLLSVNPHLTRALRARARRWTVTRFTPADGLVDPTLSRGALAAHALTNRSWSPTALQALATCPYRFLLYAIHKLEPREVPESIEEIDPLSKGSLMHEVLFRLHSRLRTEGLLPVKATTLDSARALLDAELNAVATQWRDDLAPAIDRLWEDSILEMRSDLREWLRHASEEARWTPWRFELAFGLPASDGRDPASTEEPVVLANGLRVRGSVDLVERAGEHVRATDYKTGRARRSSGVVIGGGEVLQPALYASVLQALFPDLQVSSGRLYYCTAKGGFSEVEVPLDDTARAGIAEVATLLEHALSTGFFPAAPSEGACEWCAYLPVCGSAEPRRVARKNPAQLAPWRNLRGLP